MSHGIFISYRRTDSTHAARAIYERLRAEFGPDRAFIDLESIEYGVDFIDVLNEKLTTCEVMLVLIGSNWIGRIDPTGNRLDDENDFVRLEVRTALQRGIRVIPMTVDGVAMPRSTDLPEDIRAILRLQVMPFDFIKFDSEVAKLVFTLRKFFQRYATDAPLQELNVATDEMNIEANDPLLLIHLSIATYLTKLSHLSRLDMKMAADVILRSSGERPPTFIAITGSITDSGSVAEYQMAAAWLAAFAKELQMDSLPSRRIFYTPGSDDINLRLAASSRIICTQPLTHDVDPQILLSDEVLDPDLLSFAYYPAREFSNFLSNRSFLSPNLGNHSLTWIEDCYSQLGIVFYGLNTAQPATPYGATGRHVNSDDLANLSLALSDRARTWSNRPLIIGMAHHSPVAYDDIPSVDNLDAFDQFMLATPSTGIFLHTGNRDSDFAITNRRDLSMLRSFVSTPIAGLDSNLSFNILELKRRSGAVVEVNGRSYRWMGNRVACLSNRSWQRDSEHGIIEIIAGRSSPQGT